jgi:hypothetical protein
MNGNAFLILWIVSAAIGGLIGLIRNRVALGIILGLLLGPLGWLLVLLFTKAGRKCPACLAVVPQLATKCCHCGSDLPAPVSPEAARQQAVLEAWQKKQGTKE